VRSAVSGRAESRNDRRAGRRHPDIPPLEWATALVGAALLVLAIGFMVRQALVGDDGPGPVTFVVREVRPVGAGFLVAFEARNAGGATYAELEVEGTLRGTAAGEERARATLDYLPGRSSREGGLFFRSDPARGKLELAAKGFRKP
jgi:uncharacterized protein (TIGR02588 family)